MEIPEKEDSVILVISRSQVVNGDRLALLLVQLMCALDDSECSVIAQLGPCMTLPRSRVQANPCKQTRLRTQLSNS
jgi:hypothetical protein